LILYQESADTNANPRSRVHCCPVVKRATKSLSPEVAIVTTPGSWLSDETADGLNPGEGFVRFALVPSIEQTKESAEKLKNLGL
jgi:aspartate/methionine/tyrosine aminotransferase